MTTIIDIIFTTAQGAFFYDDQVAIRQGATADGATYRGLPASPGFAAVRIPADCVSVGLALDDGEIVWGDCASVQYSGTAGRDPLMPFANIKSFVCEIIAPRLVGREVTAIDANCAAAFAPVGGAHVPLSIGYGVSQALLRAAAHAARRTMAEVLCTAFHLPLPERPIPIFAQSGDDRYTNVDKMIIKRVDALPHGLINSREKFGEGGAALREYALWVAKRIEQLAGSHYRPVLHFDTYGWVGLGLGLSPQLIADYVARLADDVPGFTLHIECPADFGSREAQIEGYARVVQELDKLGSAAKIVADEYCNTLSDVEAFCDAKACHIAQIKTPDIGNILDTLRAILYAKSAGVEAYCGGTSAETDLSAHACVHVACAGQASMMLAKPGMGVDEGITIVGNEQNRLLAAIRHRSDTKFVS